MFVYVPKTLKFIFYEFNTLVSSSGKFIFYLLGSLDVCGSLVAADSATDLLLIGLTALILLLFKSPLIRHLRTTSDLKKDILCLELYALQVR